MKDLFNILLIFVALFNLQCKSSSKHSPRVIAEYSNVLLYRGLNNLMSISDINNLNEVNISISDSISLTKDSLKLSYFNIFIPNSFRNNSLSIKVNKTDFLFRIKDIPSPIFYVGNFKKSEAIKKSYLFENIKLKAQLEPAFDRVHFEVVEYDFIYLSTVNNINKSLHIQGDLFSKELYEIVKNSSITDYIIFQNIKAKCSTGMIYESVNSLCFEIN